MSQPKMDQLTYLIIALVSTLALILSTAIPILASSSAQPPPTGGPPPTLTPPPSGTPPPNTPTVILSPTMTATPSPNASVSPAPPLKEAEPTVYFEEPVWFSAEIDRTADLAWGDVDNDGDLDLATGNYNTRNHIYLNDGGELDLANSWASDEADPSMSVAWGDMDGDGDLDLAVGNYETANRVYLNENGRLNSAPVWSSADADKTMGLAWGDVDGDGDLDLAVANGGNAKILLEEGTPPPNASLGEVNKIYLNENGILATTPVWTSSETDRTTSLAWQDVDGDGDLDLAVGNEGQPNRLYRNENGRLSDTAVWSTNEPDNTSSLVWGDMDGDGRPDLAVGNDGDEKSDQPNRVYVNDNDLLNLIPAWSSILTQETASLDWGDLDSDGDADLLVGNRFNQKQIYLNNEGRLSPEADWQGAASAEANMALADVDNDGDLDFGQGDNLLANELWLNDASPVSRQTGWEVTPDPIDSVADLAWGDVNHDGYLDLVVARDHRLELHLNTQGQLAMSSSWQIINLDSLESVAWGDVDGDDDLDLAVAAETSLAIYLNQNGSLQTTADWQITGLTDVGELAWGDVDNDGDLDLAVSSDGPEYLYLNQDGRLGTAAHWQTGDDESTSLAWGDVDNDGDLDLAIGNKGQNKLYLNEGGQLQTEPSWTAHDFDSTQGVAWGDMNGDGDLDLIVANNGSNRIYDNQAGSLTTRPSWISLDGGFTVDLAVGDIDGNGSLDLAVTSADFNGIYFNEGTALERQTSWQPKKGQGNTQAIALGDMDNDGDLDLVVGNGYIPVDDCNCNGEVRLYYNQREQQFSQVPVIQLAPPGDRPAANFYASATLAESAIIPLTYTLRHEDSQPVASVAAYYSLNGGGQWLPARGTSDTITQNLATSPDGTTHVYYWDVINSGFFGNSDNVVIRLVAQPSYKPLAHQASKTYRYAAHATTSYPFRVRGSQIRVLSGTVAISNALVYRLPKGQLAGGTLIADEAGNAFQTDEAGYLLGRGHINVGDQLLALVEMPLATTYTNLFSTSLSLYATNGQPTTTGLQVHTVTSLGLQTLSVSADQPLMLFDLDISLEWDASNDQAYLSQLEFDIQRASQYLYDFTDGQVALGDIYVWQHAENWTTSHIKVYADNSKRPYAIIGGIVLSDTTDPIQAGVTYGIGQVNMGSTWNRYGRAGENIDTDWSVTLAHELSHYLLFLEDVYIGFTATNTIDELLIAIDGCTGSAMGDVYQPNNTEFIIPNAWLPKCEQALTHQLLQRSEWANLQLWYPWLNIPETANPGPSQMPFNLSTISMFAPLTPTDTLADPTFYLDYANGEVSSSGANAFLLRHGDEDLTDYEYIYTLGKATGGQNRLVARGAQLGDRLCVFDRPRYQYGCEIIQYGDDRLTLEQDTSWTPVIRLSPVTSVTFDIEVSNISPGLTLKARLYPELGEAFTVTTLAETDGLYQGTLELAYPSLVGQVQVWVEETATEDNPRRETTVVYSIGGNPGYSLAGSGHSRGGGGHSRGGGGHSRGGGGHSRGGGGHSRGGGGHSRGGGAPVISPDGQMIFYSSDTAGFAEGEFYTVQEMTGLPDLPPGKVAIGNGYNLFATPNAPVLNGSVSIQYLGNSVLLEGKTESELVIHFWDESLQQWVALETYRDSYYNFVAAASQGPGIYALLAGTTSPTVHTVLPSVAINNVTTRLVISGENYLPPVEVRLVGTTATYTLPIQSLSAFSLTAVVTAGLPAQEYVVEVVNLNESTGPAVSATSGRLALYDPAEACFYDFFESGPSKWQTSGEWGIVTLATGEQAMTDSPTGPYNNAVSPALQRTTAITSASFSLANCSEPVLSFRQDYVIVKVGDSQDLGLVDISTDGGASWTTLRQYQTTITGVTAQAVESPEWVDPTWQETTINLTGYTGTVQIRFRLQADQQLADKGWLLDDVMVTTGSAVEKKQPVFLPLILK